MPDLDLSQLRALAAVVDEGSFDAAASALHLTPSAVSQRIKALEQSAGRVLVRRTKPTEATEAGHAYLRLARQVEALVQDVRVEVDPAEQRPPTIPLAVNGDSLATWVLPALAALAGTAYFDVRREDEGRTAELLRSGTVMAAITSDAAPVQGCRSTRLGTMRYRPMASPAFVDAWFADGVDAASLALAPVVVFDRNDDLQDAYLRQRSRRRLAPPRHHIPASSQFAEAISLGLGWGMLPKEQYEERQRAGLLVDFDPGRHVDVTLHWQQWALQTPALEITARAIREAAADHLT
ncbi:chromosome replication initiation inhibitor protein [Aeromicrobium sp. Root236]|uniref:LysR family transcriptional regulator ArgP n=1 Tax=Aeromicrobium sp. Root236 TaxID=1736498 RepID=UPI0006F3DB98|nr:LysR family transcriptional regulator ArgP [Aeromicrobium sp. Root236]KRC66606.1 chromosome replication initiation inhibitor protein [Aeromicrobium sp. Root236]